MHTLQTLQILGLDPESESAQRAVALVAQNGRWEHEGQRYFDGEVEPCINGRTIETGVYFGANVLDGLLAFERVNPGDTRVPEARRRAEEYLLERNLFRRKSTGEVVDPAYLESAFPYYWHYDVLRALDYFRLAGAEQDSRMAEAIEVVRSQQQPDGRWLLDRIHRGRVFFDIEAPTGTPSKWNTLRAMRVLKWRDGGEV